MTWVTLVCFLSCKESQSISYILRSIWVYFCDKKYRNQYFLKYYQEFSNFYVLKFEYVNKEIKILH